MSATNNMIFGNNLTFDHRAHDWSIFKSRFNQFCMANDLTDVTDKAGTRRRAILLTSLVEETYRVARDLAFPTELDELELKTLVEKLDVHFRSKKCTFAERYMFHKAEQRPGEDLAEWAARVRSLAQFCGFKATELDTALRDRFVLGLENSKEKEKLFAEDVGVLTLEKALELAQGVRCARLALRAGSPARAADVFAVSAPAAAAAAAPSASVSKKCSVCGYKNHTKEQCKFINLPCKKCNRKGHLSRMCKVRKNFYLTPATDDDDDIYEDLTM
ncbi:uncharacterized protein LOC125491017 [Plutella xylostella]|uniref:uncharacterized protein LOC125488839 n=1 Tax=Plutella xylostella TaxID=51655 RepID=UPI0020322231|nr:uncharacterized protein LOC125488839 [Plutella xylostella]XP_048487772.1 uncharacterized protein LOC125491017 [Plutella xylostella]